MSEALPEKGEGQARHHTSKALDLITPRQSRQRSASEEVSSSTEPVNTLGDIDAEILGRLEQEARQ